ncbi:MAG: hypothetical protein V3T82_07920 [Nitrospinaceae bacterium]
MQESQKYVEILSSDPEYGEKCQKSELAWTGFNDGEIIGAAGILRQDKHIGQCWMVLSDQIPMRAWPVLVKKMKSVIDQAHDRGMWRLWSSVLIGFWAGERFIQKLGFNCEGVMQHYGADGSHHALYAKIKFME